MDAQQTGQAVRGFGCLLVIAAIAVAGVLMWWNSATGNTDADKIRTWWGTQTGVSRTAFCGSVQRDPGFNGGAIGMAAAINDPDVSQYDTKAFLLEECFPG